MTRNTPLLGSAGAVAGPRILRGGQLSSGGNWQPTLGAIAIGEIDSRMNILMLSDVYFPRVNGVSTSMQTFCR